MTHFLRDEERKLEQEPLFRRGILALFIFCEFYRPQLCLGHKRTEKNLANIQPFWLHTWSIIHIYYMASSVSGQDEPNRAPWLATRAGPARDYPLYPASKISPKAIE